MFSGDNMKLMSEISFLMFDRNGNGKLEKSEFMKAMKYSGKESGVQQTDQ